MRPSARIVFMGSADISARALAALVKSGFQVQEVIAQPDRPGGRKLVCRSCPAKLRAMELGIPVSSPERINTETEVERLRELLPDVIVVVAYGQILKLPLLQLPRLGCVNVHTSLLPAYRGAAPIQWCIAKGERRSGVTTMHMSEGMDEGDLILQGETPIGDEETAGELYDRLAVMGAGLLVETLDLLLSDNAPRIPQDDNRATYAPKLRKEDGRVDWCMAAREIRNRIRAFNPWPCCFTTLPGGRRLRLLAASLADVGECAVPGTLLANEAFPIIAAGDGALCLSSVQPEGGRVMSGDTFLRGHDLPVGALLGAKTSG